MVARMGARTAGCYPGVKDAGDITGASQAINRFGDFASRCLKAADGKVAGSTDDASQNCESIVDESLCEV
jgi:hypothetical protein